MTLYLCPQCSGVLETEWIPHEDRYLHWCMVCGAEVDTEEMWKCAVMESDDRYPDDDDDPPFEYTQSEPPIGNYEALRILGALFLDEDDDDDPDDGGRFDRGEQALEGLDDIEE